MLIPEGFSVKSHLRDYQVDFVDNPRVQLSQDLDHEHILFVDQNIFRLYGNRLDLTRDSRTIEFNATEPNKDLYKVPPLVEQFLDIGVTKQTRLVVVGGGITQDMGAFTASQTIRGLAFVFYPTTLLAQADSCIGSKTSINVGKYKNQAGNFYPPLRVVIASIFQETLSLRELRSGFGEIIKVHLLDGEESFGELEKSYEESFRSPELRQRLIAKSLQIKKPFIEIDEFDMSKRNILNYGHTFGHALESATKYGIPHGQAITVGMDLANFLSWKRGLILKEVFFRIHSLLVKNFPEDKIGFDYLPSFLQALRTDKKNTEKGLGAILTHGPGKMEKIILPFDEDLGNGIKEYFELYEKT